MLLPIPMPMPMPMPVLMAVPVAMRMPVPGILPLTVLQKFLERGLFFRAAAAIVAHGILRGVSAMRSTKFALMPCAAVCPVTLMI